MQKMKRCWIQHSYLKQVPKNMAFTYVLLLMFAEVKKYDQALKSQ